MNAKQILQGLASVIIVAALSSAAQAASFDEDFESYAPSSNIHGQGGWKGWDNVAGAGAAVSVAFSFNGTKSVNVIGASDLVHEFTGVDSGQYILSIRQYIPSTSGGTSYFILLNKHKDKGASSDYNRSVQTVFNLGTGAITSDMGPGSLAMAKNQWAEIRLLIDLGANQVSEYYNGQLLTTHVWQSGGVNALAAIALHANKAGAVYYDALSVEPVPEPGTLAVLGLGALALVLRLKTA
jgi:hypothetical protein